ncbi:MAG TPA: TetR/AcrR family transcriptional regulator [Ilumatobacteraceae bacterium]|nr:TetR/AcrR family transcriptional regulator [Ilumatobacteraceae bacterium]
MNAAGRPERGTARNRILEAAVAVIRTKGLNATTVDDLCAAAGVTKGAFFHHFATKEALAVAAADYWSESTGAMFAAASYHDLPDAVDRVMGYLDLRAALIAGQPAQYTCLVGTMTQEAFETSPDVRAACAASMFGHARSLEADLAEALVSSPFAGEVSAASLARHTQTVLQGAFVLSKAANDPSLVIESIGHLRRYFEFLFKPQGD